MLYDCSRILELKVYGASTPDVVNGSQGMRNDGECRKIVHGSTDVTRSVLVFAKGMNDQMMFGLRQCAISPSRPVLS